MGKKLYVGNLPYDTGEQDLEQLFSQVGPVESVAIMRDGATGRARGFGFELHWMIVYFVLSIAFAFLLRGTFKVTI